MRTLRTALLMLVALTVLTGLVYPLVVTAIAQVVFPRAANGSLIEQRRHVVGSRARSARPSRRRAISGAGPRRRRPIRTTAPPPWLPTSVPRIRRCWTASARKSPGCGRPIRSRRARCPAILRPPRAAASIRKSARPRRTTRCSASPTARGTSADAVKRLIDEHVQGRDLGFLGEPRVNVLLVNLALDEKFPVH